MMSQLKKLQFKQKKLQSQLNRLKKLNLQMMNLQKNQFKRKELLLKKSANRKPHPKKNPMMNLLNHNKKL